MFSAVASQYSPQLSGFSGDTDIPFFPSKLTYHPYFCSVLILRGAETPWTGFHSREDHSRSPGAEFTGRSGCENTWDPFPLLRLASQLQTPLASRGETEQGPHAAVLETQHRGQSATVPGCGSQIRPTLCYHCPTSCWVLSTVMALRGQATTQTLRS